MITPQKHIDTIEQFFDRELPKDLQLNKWTYIEDVRFCVDSYIYKLKNTDSKNLADLYIEKLKEIKDAILLI